MIALPPIIQPKPPMNKPCNGCGLCCAVEACEVSVDLLGSSAIPCIALEWTGERFECGMIRRPSHYLGIKWNADDILIPVIKLRLGIGVGCGMSDEETP